MSRSRTVPGRVLPHFSTPGNTAAGWRANRTTDSIGESRTIRGGPPMTATPDEPPPPRPRWQNPAALQSAALALVAAAAAWFLLAQLAAVFRPLLMATFLAYLLLPYHTRLRTQVSGPASLLLLGSATAGILVVLALAVYASVLGLREELPRLQARAVDLIHTADAAVSARVPWLTGGPPTGRRPEERLAGQAARLAQPVLNAAADALLEACLVGLYLLFLLMEASRFPDPVRLADARERAEEILPVPGQANA